MSINPTFCIDQFYEAEACDEGLERLCEGREHQRTFTFDDILTGHNTPEDLRWFIASIVDGEITVDRERLFFLILQYGERAGHSKFIQERLAVAQEDFENTNMIGERQYALVRYFVFSCGMSPVGICRSEVHELLAYINDNWVDRK